ncbi:MAG: histone deacetylase [Phycisphaerae bacterium]|nr:histone deacetylase [Phycisphaerae bacterium]
MKHRRSKKWWVMLGVVLVAISASFVTCIPERAMKVTKNPRDGASVGKVAIVYSMRYKVSFFGLEKFHPYPQKSGDIYLQLVRDGLVKPSDVFVPKEISRKQILLVHTERFLQNLKDSKKIAQYVEFPLLGNFSSGLLDSCMLSAFRRQSGGTLLAAREALKHGIGINLGGGFHHTKPDAGEGFNIYADMAIAIRQLQTDGAIKRALIIDLDVHQGNGSAVIFADDKSVFTFSMHESDIYPIPKEQSDLDIEFDAGTGDEEYLNELADALPGIFTAARPDIVFFQSGADVLAGDPLANLQLTTDGLVKRDAMIIDACVRRGIPVVQTLGGGYGENAWRGQYRSIRRTVERYSAPPNTSNR